MTNISIKDMTYLERSTFIESAGGFVFLGYIFSPGPILVAWFFPNVWTIGSVLFGLCGFLLLRAEYKKAKWTQDNIDYRFIRAQIEAYGREHTKLCYTSQLREYEKSGGRFAKFRKKA